MCRGRLLRSCTSARKMYRLESYKKWKDVSLYILNLYILSRYTFC